MEPKQWCLYYYSLNCSVPGSYYPMSTTNKDKLWTGNLQWLFIIQIKVMA